MQHIIKDGLNKRIYEEDDTCKNCNTTGYLRRNFEENTINCRKCGRINPLPAQFLTTKDIKEEKTQ